MTLLSIVQGWSGRLGPFTLRLNGSPTSLTGLTVAVVIRKAGKKTAVEAGSVTAADQVTSPGQVVWDPDPTVIADPGTYRLRFKVTDGAGKVVYFPNDQGAQLTVYRE